MGFNIDDFSVPFNNYKCEISPSIHPQYTPKDLEYLVNTVINVVELKYDKTNL